MMTSYDGTPNNDDALPGQDPGLLASVWRR